MPKLSGGRNPEFTLADGLDKKEAPFLLSQIGFTLRGLGRFSEAKVVLSRALSEFEGGNLFERATICAEDLSEISLLIRDLHNDPSLRKKQVDRVLLQMIEYGGPLLHHSGEDQQRSFDSTPAGSSACSSSRRLADARHFTHRFP